MPLGTPGRPSWRGRLHVAALAVAVPSLALLIWQAGGARQRAGVVVYAAGLCAMLAVSATYHRWVRTVRARRAWRRADHAMIFVSIAATFTPFCLVALSGAAAARFLAGVWVVAVVGVAVEAGTRRRLRWLGASFYMILGWIGVFLAPAIWRQTGPATVVLLLVGGVVYSVGAACFAARWPVLRPAVFSYHEVWHASTLVAAGCHLAAVWLAVT